MDAVLAVGDRPATLAALIAEALHLPGHPHDGAVAASHKRLTRERLRDAGLPVPWFREVTVASDLEQFRLLGRLPVRAQAGGALGEPGSDTRRRSSDAGRGFRSPQASAARAGCPGGEECGSRPRVDRRVRRRARVCGRVPHDQWPPSGAGFFDKPDPLDGPFFEETIYVTPSSADGATQAAIAAAVERAAPAIGLAHGPVHAECRVNSAGVFVLEAAARPIGGLCARALTFERDGETRLPRGPPPVAGAVEEALALDAGLPSALP